MLFNCKAVAIAVADGEFFPGTEYFALIFSNNSAQFPSGGEIDRGRTVAGGCNKDHIIADVHDMTAVMGIHMHSGPADEFPENIHVRGGQR